MVLQFQEYMLFLVNLILIRFVDVVKSLAYAGTYGGNGLVLNVSTSTSNHTFQVEVSGGTQEVTMTVHVGNANQDITYTEL